MKFLPFLLLLAGCSITSTSSAPPPTALATPAQALGDLPASAAGRSVSVASATPIATNEAPTAPARIAPPVTITPTQPVTATAARDATPLYGLPIGLQGRVPGDGFFIRHGYVAENTWYNPGYWHTGEDWYALEGDTAGAQVYAVAEGAVVYAGANYPGRVVIVRHADDLFSMYGHLDPALAVGVRQQLKRGALIGTVVDRGDTTPNHLHFEIRTFLTTREVNGDAPRYRFRCGVRCPPGPGYWPQAAPDLPSALGWRNPTHVIARRAFPAEPARLQAEVIVATRPLSASVPLWLTVSADGTPGTTLGAIQLQPGQRYPLLAVQAGPEDPGATSAQSYQLWYRIQLADGRSGWVQAAVPSTFETGADGRPSSVYFNFFF